MFALSPLILFYSSLISSGLGTAVWVGDALSWQLSKVSCAHVQSVSASVPSQRKKCLSVHIYKNKSKVCDQGEIFMPLETTAAEKSWHYSGFSLNLLIICLTVIN